MKDTCKALTVLFAALLLMSSLGCSQKEDEPQEGHAVEADSVAPEQATQQGKVARDGAETLANLGDVLSSWNTGDKERASRQFISVNWDHPDAFADVLVLNMSQEEFMTSSKDQQMQFMRDTKSLATDLRTLGLHVLSMGDVSLASGDTATARQYYDSVLQCGRSLASKDYYELIELTAKGLIKAGQDKLLQLDGGQRDSGTFDIKDIDAGDRSWGQNLLTVKVVNRTDQEQPFWLHIGGRFQHTGRTRGFGMGMEQPIVLKPREERLVEHPYWIPPQLGELSYAVRFVCPAGDVPPQKQAPFLKKTYTAVYTTPNSKCNELTPLPQFYRWFEEYSDGTKIPPFKVVSTKRFVFYLLPDTPAEKDIAAITKRREKVLKDICDFLGVSFDRRVNFFLFPDAPSKRWCIGHQGDGLAFDTTIAEIYNEETRVDPAHELTHIVASQIGSPPALMNEGLAVYMQRDHKWDDQHIDTTASELLLKGKLVPVDELIRRNEIGSRPDDGEVAYPQSASFVKFIIDRYGREQFLKLYAGLRVGADDNATRFSNILGVELGVAEREWKKSLRGMPHEGG